MSRFVVGDRISQRHQKDAPERLVVSTIDDEGASSHRTTNEQDVVIVHDPAEDRFMKVLVRSHVLVQCAGQSSNAEARARSSSKEYKEWAAKPSWNLSNQMPEKNAGGRA